MVSTASKNSTDTGVKEEKKGMKKGTCESIFFQHDKKDLCYAMWSDNNIV